MKNYLICNFILHSSSSHGVWIYRISQNHTQRNINWVSSVFSAFKCEFYVATPIPPHHFMSVITENILILYIKLQSKLKYTTSQPKTECVSQSKWIISAWVDTTMPLSPLWAVVRDFYTEFRPVTMLCLCTCVSLSLFLHSQPERFIKRTEKKTEKNSPKIRFPLAYCASLQLYCIDKLVFHPCFCPFVDVIHNVKLHFRFLYANFSLIYDMRVSSFLKTSHECDPKCTTH